MGVQVDCDNIALISRNFGIVVVVRVGGLVFAESQMAPAMEGAHWQTNESRSRQIESPPHSDSNEDDLDNPGEC